MVQKPATYLSDVPRCSHHRFQASKSTPRARKAGFSYCPTASPPETRTMKLFGRLITWTVVLKTCTCALLPDVRRSSLMADTFSNPVLWEDYPDLDVLRVGDVFYYSSSTFAFSPGAPVLKSYDLVNWTPVTHSVPRLDFGSKYDLTSSTNRAYVKGIWASSLNYRKTDDSFYWIGCIDGGSSYIYKTGKTGASQAGGEVAQWKWAQSSILPKCYYDCGLFFDDDDTVYVAYGKTNIMVAQLSKDGKSEVKSQQVYVSPDQTYIEGSRMYKINGTYYIFVTKPASAEWVLKSKSPWGPYEMRILVDSISGPLPNAGFSHQGGIVNTKDNKWYYVAFMDSFPGGRIPVAAPLTWTSDGWPELVKDGSAWGKTYPIPVQTSKTVPPPVGTDNFIGTTLSHEWEWNHNPEDTKWKLRGGSGGLDLQTVTVTTDLFNARNTLTHRIIGPKSHGTFKIDITQMKDGDRAGAALFRDQAAYIGIHKESSASKLVMVNALSLDANWATNSTGVVAATGPSLPTGTKSLWLRVQADITPAFSGTTVQRTSTFWYSTDGSNFAQLGPAFKMTNAWQFFTGYRYAVFNHATKSLGGQITVESFTMQQAIPKVA
ncbi:glycoside hydrolase family 43 protein [Aaosphaeria arxii CBS 175.79]|uniref:Glycoside hydrolase family 43 protein n=1 Tax=Aaosphaeria arxii CBS 175.79 TaxID=1450172 RepID=A0A6A5XMH1_9PLEO|nr:glycoside hydrolase family 43 protein [Aaosphaeria arxii CBS 175.79]KAF2014069.1 glycoside hydrolase family 43 protein [Aaosphaeria arxii CBS 175.79]